MFRRKKRQRSLTSRQPNNRRLCFEPLEERRLLVGVNIDDVSVNESSGFANFRVWLNGHFGGRVNVSVETANGSAISGSDYLFTSRQLTFESFENEKIVSVQLLNNSVAESTENFFLKVTGAAADGDAVVINTLQARATIVDDDSPLPTINISDAPTALEGFTSTFTVTLSGSPANTVSVSYTTESGTALAGDDFESKSAQLFLTAGNPIAYINITLVNDTVAEPLPDEFFHVRLFGASNAQLGDDLGRGAIRDDGDVANGIPTARAGGPYSINEGVALLLDGSSSSDPDPGDTLTYEWYLNGRANVFSTAAQPNVSWSDLIAHGINDDGIYPIRLLVEDGKGGSDDETTQVSVINATPTADAGVDQSVTEPGPIVLAGVGSDPSPIDQAALRWSWKIIDAMGGTVTTDDRQTFSFTPTENGVFTVELTVEDTDGAKATDIVQLTVDLRSNISGYIYTRDWRNYPLSYGGTGGLLYRTDVRRAVRLTNTKTGDVQNYYPEIYGNLSTGAFEFHDLEPGTYEMTPFSYTGDPEIFGSGLPDNRFLPLSNQTQSFTVVGDDIQNVTMTLVASISEPHTEFVDMTGAEILAEVAEVITLPSLAGAVRRILVGEFLQAVYTIYVPDIASLIVDYFAAASSDPTLVRGELFGSLISGFVSFRETWNPATDDKVVVWTSRTEWVGPGASFRRKQEGSSDSQLYITAHSPVSMVIEDPFGRRIGRDERDPNNIIYYNEIPGIYIEDSESELLVITRGAFFSTYKLFVYGTGDGTYELDIQAVRDFDVPLIHVDSRAVHLGQVDVFGLALPDFEGDVASSIGDGALQGRVFEDRNSNSIFDPDEFGMQGRLVYLDLNRNGVFDIADKSTVTNATGNYDFVGLVPGGYSVALGSADAVQTSPRNLGAEFNVFTTSSITTDNTLNGGHSAINNRGDAVVTWVDRDFVFARRIGPDGQLKGESFLVSSDTAQNAGSRVVVADNGSFLVTWYGRGPDSTNLDIFGRLFNSDGTPRGSRFQINAPSAVNQVAATTAMWSSGDFVVVYADVIDDKPGYAIFGQRFRADGTRLGTEFIVDSLPPDYHQAAPVVAINPVTQGFVVSWSSGTPNQSEWDVYARTFDRNGIALSERFLAHASEAGGLSSKIAFDASGNWDLVWNSAGIGEDLYGQRFNSDGVMLGDQYTVNRDRPGDQHVGPQAVAVDPRGNLIAAWQDNHTGNVVARRFYRADGNSDSSEDFTVGAGSNASVSVDAAGNILISWLRAGEGVMARRLSPTFNELNFEVNLEPGASITGIDFGNVFLIGDYNRDLGVDRHDYNVWRADFGSTVKLRADGNLNGVVDAADYTVWRDNLGAGRIISRDYGDAPDSAAGTGAGNYNTLLADNGPNHTIVAGLKMGANVDNDAGEFQNVGANADDVNGASPDDEDGLANPAADLMLTVGAQPRVNVHVVNTIGTAATLYGWIDYNADGAFDNATERASAIVPNGTSNVTMLMFPTVPNGFSGVTYARFRLSRDAAAANPTGSAVGGEVEDYRATITAPSTGEVDSTKTVTIAYEIGGGPALANDDVFGGAVASLGDIDGDGVTDMAVGAVGDDTEGSSRGAVYVLFMNADGTVKSQQKIADGVGGGPTLVDGGQFGRSLASLGDLDGDGTSDLIVGANADDTGGNLRGAAYVLLMNSNGTVKASQKFASGTAGVPTLANGDLFGNSVSSLGDVDGDGVTDIVVSARFDDTGGGDRGAAHVLFMNANGTIKSTQKIASGTGGGPILADGDLFGSSVASLGDLDGDGIVDLAVSADGDDSGGELRGAVHVLFLNTNGTVKGSQKLASGTGGVPILTNFFRFGRSVTTLGDLDGDGIVDLAVGADGDDSDGTHRGELHVLFLNADGTARISRKIASGVGGEPTPASDDFFGAAVGLMGDLDGDGVTDLAVGAAGDDTGGNNRGAVHVLFLRAIGLPGDYNRNGTVESTDYDLWKSTFGQSVAVWAAADGNGNGIVDAPDYTVWRDHLGATIVALGVGSNTQSQESGGIAIVDEAVLATSDADPAPRLDQMVAVSAAHKPVEGETQSDRSNSAVATTVAPRGGSSQWASQLTQRLMGYPISAAPTRKLGLRLSGIDAVVRDDSPTIDISFHAKNVRLSEAFGRDERRRVAVDVVFDSLSPQSEAEKAPGDWEVLGAKHLGESLDELAVALNEWSYCAVQDRPIACILQPAV